MIFGYIPNSAHEELTLRPQFRSVGRSPKEDLKTEDIPLVVAVTPSSPLTHLKPLVVTHSRLTLLVSGGSLALVSLRERAGSHWSRAASGGFALLGRICGAVAVAWQATHLCATSSTKGLLAPPGAALYAKNWHYWAQIHRNASTLTLSLERIPSQMKLAPCYKLFTLLHC